MMQYFIRDYDEMIKACGDDEDEIDFTNEEFKQASEELNCSRDELVRVEDVTEGWLPPENDEEFENLYDYIFYDNSIQVKILYKSYAGRRVVIEIRGHRFISSSDTGYYYMYWNKEELKQYLKELKEDLYNKYKDYPETVNYLYDLFSKIMS